MPIKPVQMDMFNPFEPSAPRSRIKRSLGYQQVFRNVLNEDLDFQGEELQLSSYAEITVYRIVQEAMMNVVRHAKAKHVDMRIACNEGMLPDRRYLDFEMLGKLKPPVSLRRVVAQAGSGLVQRRHTSSALRSSGRLWRWRCGSARWATSSRAMRSRRSL
jgi:two-component sensor histidine kinase